MRFAFAAVLCALTLGLAGCGSEDLGGGGNNAAALLNPGPIVYWTTVGDTDSEQWNQVEELIRRFPDGEEWLAQLRREFEGDTDVTWSEVREHLGGEVVVALYGRSGETEPYFVLLTEPDDPDATVAFVKRIDREEGGDPTFTRVVDGWVAISDSQAALDAALNGDGGDSLADAQEFNDAMSELPDDALSRVYVDPAAALRAYGDTDPQARQALRMFGLDQLDFAGGWATAKDNGGELAFTLRGEGAERLLGTAEPYASTLLDHVPAEAFAFASFRGEGAKRQFEQLRDNPLYSMGAQQFEAELGVKIDELVALFEQEVAFYAAPGSPIPELTLLLESEDPQAGVADVARLLRTLAQRAGGEVTEDGEVTTARFQGFSVNVGPLEGAVAVSTAKNVFAGDGGGLGDDERFTSALEDAGVPDEYTGLTWVDLEEAVKLVMGFAGSSGETVPPEVERNLEPLRSLVVYGEQDGNVASSLMFLGID